LPGFHANRAGFLRLGAGLHGLLCYKDFKQDLAGNIAPACGSLLL